MTSCCPYSEANTLQSHFLHPLTNEGISLLRGLPPPREAVLGLFPWVSHAVSYCYVSVSAVFLSGMLYSLTIILKNINNELFGAVINKQESKWIEIIEWIHLGCSEILSFLLTTINNISAGSCPTFWHMFSLCQWSSGITGFISMYLQGTVWRLLLDPTLV